MENQKKYRADVMKDCTAKGESKIECEMLLTALGGLGDERRAIGVILTDAEKNEFKKLCTDVVGA